MVKRVQEHRSPVNADALSARTVGDLPQQAGQQAKTYQRGAIRAQEHPHGEWRERVHRVGQHVPARGGGVEVLWRERCFRG